MSIEPGVRTPQWDVADRLRKSLRESGVGVSEMASYLEVGRNTVSNWINGRNPAPGAALRLWAMRCGVSYEWIRDGHGPTGGPGITPDSDGDTHRYSQIISSGFRRIPPVLLAA